MDSKHNSEFYDELSDELLEAIDRYRHQFGREEAVRQLALSIEFLYEQETLDTNEYFRERCTSERQLAKSSFNELLSLLRTRFMFPGAIPFGSKVYIPNYGTCKVINTKYGTVDFLTPDGDIDSSDIAFPINHEIALRGGATLSDGCLVVYKRVVWKVVAHSFEENILDTILDITRPEEIGVFFKRKGSNLDSVVLEDIMIPKFMKNIYGEITNFAYTDFFDTY